MATSADYHQYNGTEEEKRSLIMEVYYPFIVETVRSTDILVHLVVLEDHFSELRMLDKEGKHAQSMMMLLRYLEARGDPRKWSLFIDALNSAGYQDLYRGLEFGEDIPMLENKTNYKRILKFLPTLIERVRLDNSGILPVLYQHEIISEHQLESTRACSRYNSNQDAILELIVHLHTKTRKWYTVFLEALLQDGHNVLVEDIDPEFMLAKKRKKKMTFNFNSLDYEDEEDRLSGSNKSASDSPPFQTNIRDYEVVFPNFPKCPRVHAKDDIVKLMKVLTLSVGDISPTVIPDMVAKKELEILTESLESWKTDKFKPWRKSMEKYIKRNTDLIRNRDDLFYLVDKWLMHLHQCVADECGEVDMYNTQIEAVSQIVQQKHFCEIGKWSNELLTAFNELKDSQYVSDSVLLQHVNYMIQQIRKGQIDNIEDFDNINDSGDLKVCGINCGKVVKRIGRMWKDLK
ncbi:hypothetical protein LOTGIDRAFT_159939 [Lottia gigantea]|uniref:CARD domain-containing protein n=1 Tax=Lottia gigantea TaxID=225164 RepID=V3ZYB3_LOTGI|nr:hypothetical protein LOTGIDRAFT_159939 [Lottia gigantea]ESO96523.1 hypothetical protein LOTGIDRAFT_159939 [Lottia gigantea]